MIRYLLLATTLLCFVPFRAFADDSDTIDSNTDVLNGHIYEVKSVGAVPKGQGIYIDMVIDPSQAEIILKRFKFKVGSDWGIVSNDSKDTIHLDSIMKGSDSKVEVVGSEAQDADAITVKIELSGFDKSQDQFTEALVDIIGESDNGAEDENLKLSLKNLHLKAIKVR